MRQVTVCTLTSFGAALLAGCAIGTKPPKDLDQSVEATIADARSQITRDHDSVTVVDKPYVDTESVKTSPHEWLENKRVTLDEPAGPLSAREIVRSLKSQGINFSWQLPLDSYYYNGAGINETNGRTALTLLFSAMGLGYEVHSDPDYVEITPMASRTWDLNIGNRDIEYESNLEDESDNEDESSDGGSGVGGGSGDGGVSGLSALTGSTQDTTTTKITKKTDFWDPIRKELAKRLTMLTPKASQTPPSAALPGQDQNKRRAMNRQSQQGSNELFTEKQVGRYSVNEDTGSITVQAPR